MNIPDVIQNGFNKQSEENMEEVYPELYEKIKTFKNNPSIELAKSIIEEAKETKPEYYTTAKIVFGTYIKVKERFK